MLGQLTKTGFLYLAHAKRRDISSLKKALKFATEIDSLGWHVEKKRVRKWYSSPALRMS